MIRGNQAKKDTNFKNKKLLIKDNIIRIGEYFKKFNFVITNGGTTLFENIYLNNKVYVLPQTNKEKIISNIFFQKNYIMGFGFQNFYKFDLNKLNNFKIKNNSIDGKGVYRILHIINNIFK